MRSWKIIWKIQAVFLMLSAVPSTPNNSLLKLLRWNNHIFWGWFTIKKAEKRHFPFFLLQVPLTLRRRKRDWKLQPSLCNNYGKHKAGSYLSSILLKFLFLSLPSMHSFVLSWSGAPKHRQAKWQMCSLTKFALETREQETKIVVHIRSLMLNYFLQTNYFILWVCQPG